MRETDRSPKNLYECYYFQDRKALWRSLLANTYTHLSSSWSIDIVDMPTLKGPVPALVTPPTTDFDPHSGGLTVEPFYRFVRNTSASPIEQLYALASFIGDTLQGFYDPPPGNIITYLGRNESIAMLPHIPQAAQQAASNTDFFAKAVLLGESDRNWQYEYAPRVLQNRIQRAQDLGQIPPEPKLLERKIQRDIEKATKITDMVYQEGHDILWSELETYFSSPFYSPESDLSRV